MRARRMQYIEVYVREPNPWVRHLANGFGFAEVARSGAGGAESVMLRQGLVTVAVTGRPKSDEHLAGHAEGVGNIGIICDEVPAVLAAARRYGACCSTDGQDAVVSGYGGFCCTLVDAGRAGVLGPSGRSWAPVARRPQVAVVGERVQRVDHLAICVEAGALEETVDFYRTVFGLRQTYSEYIQVGDQAMDSVVVDNGAITLTLLEPDASKPARQVDGFLRANGGAGVQHVAFLVDDVVAAVQEQRANGVRFLRTPAEYYAALAERLPELAGELGELSETGVLADRDDWGHLLQVFTTCPHAGSAMFYELIERRGARLFGSRNIRALYEAVAREVQNVGTA
jgi:4-hydroxymandelate synthase